MDFVLLAIVTAWYYVLFALGNAAQLIRTFRVLYEQPFTNLPVFKHPDCIHLSEYFEMSGKTLRKKTDQTVEATHSKFDNFIRAHNYKIRDVESEKAGEYLLKAVKHFNSYNLGKID